MKFCTTCGREADEDTRFCKGCGSPLGEPKPEPKPTEAPPVVEPAPPEEAAPAEPQRPPEPASALLEHPNSGRKPLESTSQDAAPPSVEVVPPALNPKVETSRKSRFKTWYALAIVAAVVAVTGSALFLIPMLGPGRPSDSQYEDLATYLLFSVSPRQGKEALGAQVINAYKEDGLFRFYGKDVLQTMELFHLVATDQLQEKTNRFLADGLRDLGCGDTLGAIASLEGPERSAAFASSCPPSGERLIPPEQVASTHLPLAMTAIMMEARARAADLEDEPFHRFLVAYLLDPSLSRTDDLSFIPQPLRVRYEKERDEWRAREPQTPGEIDTGGGVGERASMGRKGTARVGELKLGEGASQGFCNRGDISKNVRMRVGAIRACYEQQLQVKPSLAGKVTIRWTIHLDGSVKGAAVAESSLNDGNVENCILRAIRRIRFAKPEGGICIVKWPFVFNPGAARLPGTQTEGRPVDDDLAEPSAPPGAGEHSGSIPTHEVFGTASDQNAPWLALRAEPDKTAALVAQMTDGTGVRILGEARDGWVRLEVVGGASAGRTGFAFAKWLRPVEPNRFERARTEDSARTLVEEWVRAQNAGDFARYAACYCQNMTGVRTTRTRRLVFSSRSEWLDDRRSVFDKAMRVGTSDLAVSMPVGDSGEAVAHFTQYYAAGSYADCGPKTLRLQQTGEGSCISYEEMEESWPWRETDGFVCSAANDGASFTYRARLSTHDHRNSKGTPLKSAAAVLRQDRANYHSRGQRDAEDQNDPSFADRGRRAWLAERAQDALSTADARRILAGTPLVEVTVSGQQVSVRILD